MVRAPTYITAFANSMRGVTVAADRRGPMHFDGTLCARAHCTCAWSPTSSSPLRRHSLAAIRSMLGIHRFNAVLSDLPLTEHLMQSPKLLVTIVTAVSVIGAATFAFAQTTPNQPMPNQTGSQTGAANSQGMTGNTGTMTREAQMGTQTNPTSPSTTDQRNQTNTNMGTTGTMGNTTTNTMRRDDTNTGTTMQNNRMGTSSNTGTMGAERSARADRN